MIDEEGVADRAAREIARHLTQAQRERGVAHLALSGGTTPRRAYELLAEQHEDWSGVEIWFVDERCVGPEDELSNYRLACETLLARAPIAPKTEMVHRMEGELGPQLGAERYAAQLKARLPHTEPAGEGAGAALPILDVAVLGIGPDGHVASLFPGASALDGSASDASVPNASAQEPCLPVLDSPKPPPERITLSLGVLRVARRCVLLATGSSKADALSAAIATPTPHVPASLLVRERLTIIADDAASPPAPVR